MAAVSAATVNSDTVTNKPDRLPDAPVRVANLQAPAVQSLSPNIPNATPEFDDFFNTLLGLSTDQLMSDFVALFMYNGLNLRIIFAELKKKYSDWSKQAANAAILAENTFERTLMKIATLYFLRGTSNDRVRFKGKMSDDGQKSFDVLDRIYAFYKGTPQTAKQITLARAAACTAPFICKLISSAKVSDRVQDRIGDLPLIYHFAFAPSIMLPDDDANMTKWVAWYTVNAKRINPKISLTPQQLADQGAGYGSIMRNNDFYSIGLRKQIMNQMGGIIGAPVAK